MRGNCEENQWPKESSGRILPKTNKLRGDDIVKAVKTQRLRWCGHIRRMGEEKVVKKETG